MKVATTEKCELSFRKQLNWYIFDIIKKNFQLADDYFADSKHFNNIFLKQSDNIYVTTLSEANCTFGIYITLKEINEGILSIPEGKICNLWKFITQGCEFL